MYYFLRPGIACMDWENCPTQNCKACNYKQSETCKECYAETVKRLVPDTCSSCKHYDRQNYVCPEIRHEVFDDDFCSFWSEKEEE